MYLWLKNSSSILYHIVTFTLSTGFLCFTSVRTSTKFLVFRNLNCWLYSEHNSCRNTVFMFKPDTLTFILFLVPTVRNLWQYNRLLNKNINTDLIRSVDTSKLHVILKSNPKKWIFIWMPFSRLQSFSNQRWIQRNHL